MLKIEIFAEISLRLHERCALSFLIKLRKDIVLHHMEITQGIREKYEKDNFSFVKNL